jgi:hypothetical protein
MQLLREGASNRFATPTYLYKHPKAVKGQLQLLLPQKASARRLLWVQRIQM